MRDSDDVFIPAGELPPKTMKQHKHHLIPPLYFQFMQLFGVFPFAVLNHKTIQNTNAPAKLCGGGLGFLWTLSVGAVISLIGICDLWSFISSKMFLIKTLDFDTCIMLIYRTISANHAALIMISMMSIGRKLQHFSYDIELTIENITKRRIADYTACFVCLWTVFCMTIIGFVRLFAYNKIVCSLSPSDPSQELNWNYNLTLFEHFYNHLPDNVLSTAAAIVSAAGYILTSFLPFLLIMRLVVGFQHVGLGLQHLAESDGAINIRIAFRQYHQLFCQVTKINKMFRVILTLAYFKDLMTVLTLFASLMEIVSPYTIFDEENLGQWNQKTAIRFVEISSCVINMISTSIRVNHFIWANQQAEKIKSILTEITAITTDQEVRKEASMFANSLGAMQVAVSGFGFSLTKEYTTTVGGIILAYILLVYQASDQKRDLGLVQKSLFISLNEIKQATLAAATKKNITE